MKVGFIGLGIMGYHMACNLSKSGYQVYVYDIMPEAVKGRKSQGVSDAQALRRWSDSVTIS